jgi:hypothetical protein
MQKKPFGCLTIPGIVTAVLTMLVVLVVGLLRGGVLFSPGPLNAQAGGLIGSVTSHADLSGRCAACHAYFWQNSTMADRCVQCHVDVASQLQDPTTLHGDQFKKNPGITCRYCHPDHHGANAPLTDMTRVNISHADFGYSLAAHQRQTDGSPFFCKTCHVNGFATFDQAVCITCHQAINADFMQNHLQAFCAGCLACHDGIDSYGHNFDHAKTAFQLTGKHSPLDCGACHNGARTITDLKAASQDCYACHAKDDAHQGAFGSSCGTCHTPDGWLPANFDHSKTVFPLTGAHLKLDCTQCHTNRAFTALPTDCYSCHARDDAHDGQFGRSCGTCHITEAWLPATFDHFITKFPLTGVHATLACTQCHINQVFTTLPADCVSCHPEPSFHSGLFPGMNCDQCHTTTAWSPATFNLIHPNSCGEVICINHEGATCRDCHTVNLSTATCLKCHTTNNPGDGGGGRDGGDD